MVWDVLLYVPTVTALFSIAAKFWYGDEINLAYLLTFLGFFFLIAGSNRILKTRLMLLPLAPIALEVDGSVVSLVLRNGKRAELIKNFKYYSDYSGRTFGLSGIDGAGRSLQFVLHKGQFASEQEYLAAQNSLRNHR